MQIEENESLLGISARLRSGINKMERHEKKWHLLTGSVSDKRRIEQRALRKK